MRSVLAIAIGGLLRLCPARLAAQDPDADTRDDSRDVWVVFPEADFYPHYIADPLTSQSALIVAGVTDSSIPETGDARFILRLGGSFPLFRRHPADEQQTGLQLDFEGEVLRAPRHRP